MRIQHSALVAAGIGMAGLPATAQQVHLSDTGQLGFVVNGDSGTWGVSPDVRPDEYKVYCVGGQGVVELIGARTPIRYTLLPGDTAQFVILLNGDSAFTRFIGMPWVPAARFTPGYVSANRGRWNVEIPPVQELMLTAIALTPTGMADSNLIAHEGAYYRELQQHFGPHRNSAVVADIEALLQRNPASFSKLVMDANVFHFEGDRLVGDSIYDRLSWDNTNQARPLLPALEEFAKASAFQRFFSAHRTMYDSLCTATRAAMPVDAMWSWLEQRFDERYDNYRVIISPLMEGSHSTNNFGSDGFRQSVMFICPAYTFPSWSPGLTEGQNTRIVFTEIDHNYVNPVSDRHMAAIAAALADLPVWATEAARNNYHNAYAVFNEYMTFGVFLLYARDRLPAEDFTELRKRTVKRMEQSRGFSRFGAFQDLLEAVYGTSADKRIAPLYPALLEGCKDIAH